MANVVVIGSQWGDEGTEKANAKAKVPTRIINLYMFVFAKEIKA